LHGGLKVFFIQHGEKTAPGKTMALQVFQTPIPAIHPADKRFAASASKRFSSRKIAIVTGKIF